MIDCDDTTWSWDTEVQDAEEMKRVFQGMMNFYYDIRYVLWDDYIRSFMQAVVLPQLSYLTGGKEIIERGSI